MTPSLSLPVRPLVIVLAVQVLLGGVLVVLIATGTLAGWLDGGDDTPATTQTAASAPAAPPAAPAVAAAPAVPRARVNRIDGNRAMAWARRQVALGPRPAGSPAQREAALFLRDALPFGRFVPIGGGLRNIEGRIAGKGSPILVIAHYDTTPVKDYVGANNSAAAVGVVLEVARWLRRHNEGGRPVRFLLTDGEEAPDYPVSGDFYEQGVRGSRAAAAKPPRPSAVVVLDFVGQKGLRIRREANSDPDLWERLRTAAKRVGVGAVFPDETQNEVLDDHTAFIRRGVPAIDLIDFDYACWQKPCDTLDKLSVRSMDASGEAVVELLRGLRRG